MSADQSGIRRLIHEAHRRSLWQVLLIYVGASWAVLELVDHIIGRFGMPDWSYGFAVMLLVIGLPFCVARQWSTSKRRTIVGSVRG